MMDYVYDTERKKKSGVLTKSWSVFNSAHPCVAENNS